MLLLQVVMYNIKSDNYYYFKIHIKAIWIFSLRIWESWVNHRWIQVLFFEIPSMVYLQDFQLDVCVLSSLFFKKVYFLIWNETRSFMSFFMLLYFFYYKWLLSFSNEHTSVAEKLWLPGRKKNKSWTSKQSRMSPIACLPHQWRSNSSKAAAISQDFLHFICHYIPLSGRYLGIVQISNSALMMHF